MTPLIQQTLTLKPFRPKKRKRGHVPRTWPFKAQLSKITPTSIQNTPFHLIIQNTPFQNTSTASLPHRPELAFGFILLAENEFSLGNCVLLKTGRGGGQRNSFFTGAIALAASSFNVGWESFDGDDSTESFSVSTAISTGDSSMAGTTRLGTQLLCVRL